MKKRWIILASLAFILLNAILISLEMEIFTFLPIFLISLLIYLWFPMSFYLTYITISPLSIPLSEILVNQSFDLWLPSELMIAALVPLAFHTLMKPTAHARWFTWHPIFLTILFLLGWLLLATISSTIPVVSIKYFVLRIFYFLVLFFLPFSLFVNNQLSFAKFIGCYSLGFLTVVGITLTKQWQQGLFDKFVANGTCNPFYTDHTSYAAVIAMLIPVSLAMAVVQKSSLKRIILTVFFAILLVAMILSYTRAAWLSLMVAFGVWLVWLVKLRFRYLAIISFLLAGLVYGSYNNVMVWLNQHKTASSDDLSKHVSSIANIRTDESNVERLNRWTSAIRMSAERPMLGWGPGTYMFQYAPFQSSYLKTRESSNLGLKGNAHSEYLGLLADAGVPAALAFLIIIVLTLYKGFALTTKLKVKSRERILLIGVLIGWITYIVHGMMNNFLDMDKVALLFWGYMAYILALEFHYTKSNPSIDISSKTSTSESR